MKFRHYWKLYLAVAFGLLSYYALSLATVPFRNQTSVIVGMDIWVTIGLLLLIGQVLLLAPVFAGSVALPTRRLWTVGLLLVAATYLLYFAAPYIQGIYMYATPLSDGLYHLGLVKDVLTTGHIPPTVYPANHAFISILIHITGIDVRLSQPIVAYLFMIFLVLSAYVLATAYSNRAIATCCLVATVPLLFGDGALLVRPWYNSLAFLTLIIGLSLRQIVAPSNRFRVLLAVFLCAIVFFHPVTALFGVAAALVSWVMGRSPFSEQYRTTSQETVKLAFATLIVLFFWNLTVPAGETRVGRAIVGLAGNPEAGAARYAGQAQQTSFTLVQLFWEYIVLRWGPLITYLGMASLIVLLILTFRRFRPNQAVEVWAILQYGASLFFLIVFVAVGVLEVNPSRISRYAIICSILLIGLAMGSPVARRERWGIVPAVVVIVVLVTTIWTVGIGYQTDTTLQKSTLNGAEWHITYQNDGFTTKSFRMANNVEVYLLSWDGALERESVTFSRYQRELQIPKHLGYHNESKPAVPDRGLYLITKRSDLRIFKDIPANRRTETLYYTKQDLGQLETDPRASKVYTNGQFTDWLLVDNGS